MTESVVVVGVDGSDASIDALRWSARQADLTGAELHVVTAWCFPEHPTPFGIVPELPAGPDPTAAVRAALDAVVDAVVPAALATRVRCQVVHGAPATVLLDAARTAELLVVGSHGRGALAGWALGSVSERCLRLATCPVVVVRHGAGG